jgi:acyl-CoA synthetase (AMP-forming)/AMP-acid ligase II
MTACNIASFLPQMALQRPDAVAVAVTDGRGPDGKRRYQTSTYAQLDQRSDQIARGLQAYGLARGTRTVLMVKPSLEFFALTFGLFKAGIVPVLIDPGLGRKQLGQCLAEAKPEAFIGIPAAQAARLVLGWGRPTITKVITVGRRWAWGGTTLEHIAGLGQGGGPLLEATEPDETAAILFTSGSTGVAKGVVYAHRHFVQQVELIRSTYGIEPGEVDLPTFPLFALFDPALGMTTVVPDMDFTRPASVDPAMLAELIADWKVTNVFGSPALLATVVRAHKQQPQQWATVRRVISAGAPVPTAVLAGMTEILPAGAEVVTPYGATECLPVASIGSKEVLAETGQKTASGAGVCVGRVVAPNDVRIIAVSDSALPDWSAVTEVPQGEIGEIVVLGPTTTTSYFGRDNATQLAKIQHPNGLFHRMGDTGWFDAQGRLWYCGRKSHRVELATGVLHTAPVEEIFNGHKSLRRTALVGIGPAGQKQAVLCLEREPGSTQPDAAVVAELRALSQQQQGTREVQRFAFHPGFPVDIRHNAKIGREILTVWAEAQAKSGRLL